jgi:hypothetical protein
MTEAEWQSCTDVKRMLDWLAGKNKSRKESWFSVWRGQASASPAPTVRVSDRKLRLFACACCETIWDLLSDDRSRHALETAEQFADGKADVQELYQAQEAAESAWATLHHDDFLPDVLQPSLRPNRALAWAARAAVETTEEDGYLAAIRVAEAVARTAEEVAAWDAPWAARVWGRASLVRDIFGNPFRTVSIDPAWLTRIDGTVAKLAQVVYEQRRFEDLPILADALMDAGCADDFILNHCRQPGTHVRGCWLVDLLLAKE